LERKNELKKEMLLKESESSEEKMGKFSQQSMIDAGKSLNEGKGQKGRASGGRDPQAEEAQRGLLKSSKGIRRGQKDKPKNFQVFGGVGERIKHQLRFGGGIFIKKKSPLLLY